MLDYLHASLLILRVQWEGRGKEKKKKKKHLSNLSLPYSFSWRSTTWGKEKEKKRDPLCPTSLLLLGTAPRKGRKEQKSGKKRKRGGEKGEKVHFPLVEAQLFTLTELDHARQGRGGEKKKK